MKQKAIFLDRDGVLNVERGHYVYDYPDFEIAVGVPEGLIRLHEAGYKLIVVTNQGGITKGLYTTAAVWRLHQDLQKACHGVLDALYFSPYHDGYSRSLMRKPDSLMLERGIAKFNVDPAKSWLIGDAERDLIAADKVGVAGRILIPTLKETQSRYATHIARNFTEAVDLIL